MYDFFCKKNLILNIIQSKNEDTVHILIEIRYTNLANSIHLLLILIRIFALHLKYYSQLNKEIASVFYRKKIFVRISILKFQLNMYFYFNHY